MVPTMISILLTNRIPGMIPKLLPHGYIHTDISYSSPKTRKRGAASHRAP